MSAKPTGLITPGDDVHVIFTLSDRRILKLAMPARFASPPS
ncbi:hypothetical protein [Actinomadura gamaensis]|uniref:Uncharacterized protein n=1 Tax=Actinomadura gamaensis TaxID=1763541 RepID=A0ABV9UC33_9ACTN